MNYLSAKTRKEAGVHYTPQILANFVAKQIVSSESFQFESEKIRLLDPAVGNGQLLISMLEVLSIYGFSNIELYGFDTNSDAIEIARQCLSTISLNPPILLNCDFLDFVLTNFAPNGQRNLFAPTIIESFDIVIANPPYVRTQVMGKSKAQKIARQFDLSGRIDLYYAFIGGIANVLRPNGIAGIIVSNRFLTTKSGSSIRKKIAEKFDIIHIWDLGDTQLFEAAILPAVLLLRRKHHGSYPVQSKFTSIYSTTSASPEHYTENVLMALDEEGVVRVSDGNCYQVRQGNLAYDKNPAGVWHMTTQASEDWLERVKSNTFCTFGDIGKIRVGVKTTADKVFIRSDWQDMPAEEKPELLRPLITHHVARRFRAIQAKKNQREILYPHQVVEGKRVVVNLKEFPKSAKYLYSHRSILEKREYVLKAGREWYEIWVPQDPEAWQYPKVVFRDITDKPIFWMDLSGSIVNGDCYWLTCKNFHQIDILWLIVAVGNSTFIETFYDYRFHNKLYSGRRRFITQYVKNFPLPDPNSPISEQIIQTAKNFYNLILTSSAQYNPYPLEKKLNQLVWQAFGLSVEEVT